MLEDDGLLGEGGLYGEGGQSGEGGRLVVEEQLDGEVRYFSYFYSTQLSLDSKTITATRLSIKLLT